MDTLQRNLNPGHIDSGRRLESRPIVNAVQVFMIVGILFGFVWGILFTFLGSTALYLALLIMAGIIFWAGDTRAGEAALATYHARPLQSYQAPGLFNLTSRVAYNAGLETVPRLFTIPSSAMNAFAVKTRQGPVVALSEGLLARLNGRELHGVLAHEVSHIAAGDLFIMALVQLLNRVLFGLVQFFQIFVLAMLPLMLTGFVQIDPVILLLVCAGPFAGIYLQRFLSRLREYNADLNAVRISGDPHGLMSALYKIGETTNRGFLRRRQISESNWLDTHPPLEARLARLVQFTVRRG